MSDTNDGSTTREEEALDAAMAWLDQARKEKQAEWSRLRPFEQQMAWRHYNKARGRTRRGSHEELWWAVDYAVDPHPYGKRKSRALSAEQYLYEQANVIAEQPQQEEEMSTQAEAEFGHTPGDLIDEVAGEYEVEDAERHDAYESADVDEDEVRPFVPLEDLIPDRRPAGLTWDQTNEEWAKIDRLSRMMREQDMLTPGVTFTYPLTDAVDVYIEAQYIGGNGDGWVLTAYQS